LALIEHNACISASTSEASSPVLDNVGSCFNDAFSTNTLKGASDGIWHRKRGLVLYIAIPLLWAACAPAGNCSGTTGVPRGCHAPVVGASRRHDPRRKTFSALDQL